MRVNGHTASKAFVDLFTDAEIPSNARNTFVAEQDDNVILSHLEFAEKLFPHSGLSLCPVTHTKVKYLSKSCEKILGHPHGLLLNMSLAEYFMMIHPDDLAAVQQCFGFIKNQKPGDPEIHRFAVYYRFRNQNGEYNQIRNDNFAIRVREGNYLYLMAYSISAEKFFHVKLEVYKRINGNLLKTYTYSPQQEDKEMTPRQNDVVELVNRGFTNREIAEKLGISIHTVKNHKQMLFKKINVRNSVELANYVGRLAT